MFFLLSKLLQYLISPLLWILALLFLGLFWRNEVSKRKMLWAGIILLVLFTNPFLSNEAWLAWEPEAVAMREVGAYDAAIVLTGVTEPNKSPHDRVHYGEGAERILDAIQLYKAGKLKKIIISGGSGAIKDVAKTEASRLQQTALLAGIPADDILLEDRSRNTRENALFNKELVQANPKTQKLLLITSAFHMPRALACFQKVNLAVDTFPADFHTHDRSFQLDDLLIPDPMALYRWTHLIHEWVGYLVYKVSGYA